ncbi:peptide chain release factor N(5)-glutamine methyltransferase [Egibacter rhizosphaerae]|uniref:Release factor glutamine methyltransferase n=1 Tax=Egibacter rhizosphaerae TaxID=1670831 RepID=A0A411YD70_9ACTN|nr:peptide chain release factor N(5)-glutamine methyltransferase [Egibacter rhizosphaerae]QBI19126.1 peptide chain release factor N(5)-glutamine methyltransferase [Egibacter rhizosphaerae]
MSPTVRDVRARTAATLAAAGVPSPTVDADALLCAVLDWRGSELATRADAALPAPATERLGELVDRRAAREPLQLVLGTTGFRHVDLMVGPGVFVPRPETEILAGEAIARTPEGGVVVEPCTGTGAVAIAVATEARPGEVHATDREAAAVDLARHNARRCGAAVSVARGDLLDPLPLRLCGSVDVLVANPPYVAEGETGQLPPEVAGWDPRSALVAGPTGHEVSDRLLALAGEWLTPGGWVLLEVAEHRAAQTAARAERIGLVEADVVRDLAGRDRVVLARRSGPARVASGA